MALEDDFLKLITAGAKSEIKKTPMIKQVNATVTSTETNGKIEVKLNNNSPSMSFYNKTGQPLAIGDNVKIYYWKSLTDGYIGYKNGAYLNFNNITSVITDDKGNYYIGNGNSSSSSIYAKNNYFFGKYCSVIDDDNISFHSSDNFLFGYENLIGGNHCASIGSYNILNIAYNENGSPVLKYKNLFSNDETEHTSETYGFGYKNCSIDFSTSLGLYSYAEWQSTVFGYDCTGTNNSTSGGWYSFANKFSTALGYCCLSGIDVSLNSSLYLPLDNNTYQENSYDQIHKWFSCLNLFDANDSNKTPIWFGSIRRRNSYGDMSNGFTNNNGFSFVTGYNSIANQFSSSVGFENYAIQYSGTIGTRNFSSNNSFSLGYELTTCGIGMTGVGRGNLYQTDQIFVVGNGYRDTPSNAFVVNTNGNASVQGTISSTGADYAEYWEWEDENIDNEDRRGLFVTIINDKIQLADSESTYILGVTSARPSVLGDDDNSVWHDKYLKDIFGEYIYEDKQVPITKVEEYIIKDSYIDQNGKNIPVQKGCREVETGEFSTIRIKKINPNYNPDLKYIPRKDRKEFIAVAHLGKIIVVDDGTCIVGSFCMPMSGGIATKSDNGYMVLSRIDESHIRIWMK